MPYVSINGSISFVIIITTYSPNCSLQNADMHGHELFLAMDENLDQILNFFKWSMFQNRVRTNDRCFNQMNEQTFLCLLIHRFSCSVEHMFRRSDVQTFRRSSVQTIRRIINFSIKLSIIQSDIQTKENSFK